MLNTANANVANVVANDDEDYSDMPPLVYDDAPTPLYNIKENDIEEKNKNVDNVENDEVDNQDDNENQENDDVENEDDNEIQENEENEENEENDDVDDEDEDEDEDENVENMFVLSSDQHPIRYSSDLQTLCRWRDQLVKKETYTFGTDGTVYVSHAKNNKNNKNIIETTLLTYMDRNLLWNTERTLKTFTIHRINKI